MKIGYIVGFFPAVSETFILNQILWFLQQKHSVVVYARQKGFHHTPDLLNHPNLTIVYRESFDKSYDKRLFDFLKSFFNHPEYRLSMLKSLNVFKYGYRSLSLYIYFQMKPFFINGGNLDVISAHFGGNGEYASLMKKLGVLKCDFITTFHGTDINKPQIKGKYNLIYTFGKVLIANSSFTMKNMARMGFDESKITILPMGTDTSQFMSKANRPNNQFNIISIGRLVEFKGFTYAIDVIKLLLNKGFENVNLSIIGDGPLRKELERKIFDEGLINHVRITGFLSVEEIKKKLNESHIFIYTGITDAELREESQGVVLQEAQAMELPIVASDVGGVKESFSDGESGILYKQKDTQRAADIVAEFIMNPSKVKYFGEAGRLFVKNNFEHVSSMKKLETIMSELSNN